MLYSMIAISVIVLNIFHPGVCFKRDHFTDLKSSVSDAEHSMANYPGHNVGAVH